MEKYEAIVKINLCFDYEDLTKMKVSTKEWIKKNLRIYLVDEGSFDVEDILVRRLP